MKRNIILLIAWCLLSGIASATFSETAPSGPYHLDPVRDSALAVAGISLTLAGNHAVSRVRAPDPSSLNRDNVPSFDRAELGLFSDDFSKWSDRTRDVCLTLPLIVAASSLKKGEKDSWKETVISLSMYIESNCLMYGLTALAKGTARRSRPYAYNQSIPDHIRRERNASLSFWSGHSAAAFNGAVFACTVFQAHHPQSSLVKPCWAIGLSAAAATGYLRVRAGQHFPTDVIAGGAAGSFTGWLVPRLHRGDSRRLVLTSMVNGAPGLNVSLGF